MQAEVFSVCLFCGAKPGLDPFFRELARRTGRAIAERGWRLVYGGGGLGLMGAAADAALEAGGEVVGVIPEGMLAREQGHRSLSRLEVVPDMAVRKTRMIALSDGFIALPGGLGTLDELFEVLTLVQTRKAKPVPILLYGSSYWKRLFNFEVLLDEGAISPGDLELFHYVDSPQQAWEQIKAFYRL